jgi:hypothetical protein
VGCQTNRTIRNMTTAVPRAAPAIRRPRRNNAMRRNCVYSRKQGEQLTMCEAGISSSVSRRSRYAMAFKLERLGQPTRSGFGKPLLEYFLPRATTSLTNLEDVK